MRRRGPFDEAGIDAALQDEVLDQAADVVVGKRGAHRRAEAEAAAQAARDIVFAAAFQTLNSRAQRIRLRRVEAEHDLAQRDLIVLAGGGGFDGEGVHNS